MKTRIARRAAALGVSLIETLGAIAVLAIFASLMVPVVSDLINSARITAIVMSANAMQEASLTYFQQYGKFGLLNGEAITWTNDAHEYWDRSVLCREQLLEKTLYTRLASASYVRLAKANTSATADVISSDNIGHLGSLLCNNAVYDLTQEYSSSRRNGHDGLYYARAGSREGARAGFLARPALAGAGFNPNSVRFFIPRAIHACLPALSWLSRSLGNGLSPLRSCYPAPFSPPPPGVGGGTGSDNPAHSTRPPANNDAHDGSVVVELILENMSLYDAYRLSLIIDGRAQSNWAYWDSVGRVKYDFISSKTGPVYIYLAHH